MAERAVPEDPLRFLKWFVRNKFRLMESFLPELTSAPESRDPDALERRFRHATRHGRRVLAVRLGLIVFLAVSGSSSLITALLGRLSDVPAVEATLRGVTLVGTALFALSGLIFLLINRYLDLVTTSATFLGMQLAACRHAEGAEAAESPAEAEA